MKKTLTILALLVLSPVYAQDSLGTVYCLAGSPQCLNAATRQASAKLSIIQNTGCSSTEAACAAYRGNQYTFKLIESGSQNNHFCENWEYTYEVAALADIDPLGNDAVSWVVGGNPSLQKVANGNAGCNTVIGFTVKLCQPWAWYPAITYPSQTAALESGENFLSIRIFGEGQTIDPYSGEGICHDVAVMPEESDMIP